MRPLQNSNDKNIQGFENPNPVGLMNSFKNLTLTVNNCEAIMSSDKNKKLRELNFLPELSIGYED